jgi:hypothetical protein
VRVWLALTMIALAIAAAQVGGCATGGTANGDDAGVDSSTPKDGAPSGDSGNCPTGHTGPNCQNCAGGFHACGSNCEQDHPNVPDAGCSQGCNGTPCPTPSNGTAKCTSEGLCDSACGTGFDKTDAGCQCPSGQMNCFNVCQQCCQDSDCPSNTKCNSGTCGGCQPGWGDCNNNMGDGCETHLNSTSNCGSCGHGCCGSFCGCGFLGVGGESCNASGNTFACGC